MTQKSILFEPWALGDTLIAASALALSPAEFVLVCQSKWHPIVSEAVGSAAQLDLIGIETSYEAKSGKKGIACSIDSRFNEYNGCPVYSIRGDLRDYYLARKIFTRSAVRMNGWLPFLARKLPLVDLPYRMGLFPVRNRYRMWTDLLGLDFARLEGRYLAGRDQRRALGRVALHVGSQWKSKQYPAVAGLAALLRDSGREVEILAGEGDPLPEGVAAREVRVVMGRELVASLTGYDFVVANDSGPMHLAALLGTPTVAIGLGANLDCWAPPGALLVKGEGMPRGYAPRRGYWSERGLAGWPAPERVLEELRKGRLL